jgi:hypothetical protein
VVLVVAVMVAMMERLAQTERQILAVAVARQALMGATLRVLAVLV